MFLYRRCFEAFSVGFAFAAGPRRNSRDLGFEERDGEFDPVERARGEYAPLFAHGIIDVIDFEADRFVDVVMSASFREDGRSCLVRAARCDVCLSLHA
jgi:hypothetical protein